MPSRAEMGADWPDFGPGEYLWHALTELGPIRAMPTGGRRAVDWHEIAGFAQAMGPFERWELETLREMARAYLDGFLIGENPLGKDPAEE